MKVPHKFRSMQSHTSTLQKFQCPKKITPFSPVDCDYNLVPVKCVNVYDGDTVKLAFHLFNDPSQQIFIFPCRLMGIDTPEMKSSNPKEKEMATNARDYLRSKVSDKCIWAKFYSDEHEKYGRLLVELYETPDAYKSINTLLIENGYAYAYDGGTKNKII